MSLDQWLREHELFNRMMRIGFFHKYRVWKAFHSWRTTIRSTRMDRVSARAPMHARLREVTD